MDEIFETRQEIARREVAQREMARRRFLPYVTRFKPDYQVGWVHKVFAAKLEKFYQDVQDGKQPRLMIFVPPRHGKSELVSNNFPSWVLGKDPTLDIIMASYSIQLPTEFSKDNRARMHDERYAALFPDARIASDSKNAERWKTTKGGGLKCAGVGGGISGFGADIFIIDDPVKDYEDSQSETIREIAKNWYTSTADSRLSPKGGVIIVQTRWHDDDLSGWRLRTMEEARQEGVPDEELEHWDVVSFPALAEKPEYLDIEYNLYNEPGPGRFKVRDIDDPLHACRYPESRLKRIRAGMPSQQWSALYQQNPVPDSGEFFQKGDFVYYSSTPQLHQYPVLFSWDLAVGEKRTNDYTVGLAGVVIPKDGVNTIKMLDMFRGRVRDKELTQAVVNMWLKYKHNAYRLGMEHGQIFLSIEKMLLREFSKVDITPSMDRELKPVTDKKVRATPARGWMQHHRIEWPRHQPWVSTVESELLRFDAGVNDDIVDALAWMVRMAEKMPLVRPMEKNKSDFGHDSVEKRLRDYMREQRNGTGEGYMTA